MSNQLTELEAYSRDLRDGSRAGLALAHLAFDKAGIPPDLVEALRAYVARKVAEDAAALGVAVELESAAQQKKQAGFGPVIQTGIG